MLIEAYGVTAAAWAWSRYSWDCIARTYGGVLCACPPGRSDETAAQTRDNRSRRDVGGILHREAQVDPLLLAGIARVALEKIDGATGVILRLHPQNGADWRAYLSTRLDTSDLPEIIGDPSLVTPSVELAV